MTPMMKCGHAANAHVVDATTRATIPACAICFGISPGADVVDLDGPTLDGRTARCSCGRTEPSDARLPFFEYLGPGSQWAATHCAVCNYHRAAHEPGKTQHGHGFTAHDEGRDTDGYYCGCRGWD